MGKMIVIYHSQQYGNTKILAEALAEGAQEVGAEVNLTCQRRSFTVHLWFFQSRNLGEQTLQFSFF